MKSIEEIPIYRDSRHQAHLNLALFDPGQSPCPLGPRVQNMHLPQIRVHLQTLYCFLSSACAQTRPEKSVSCLSPLNSGVF